jgi:hypothetical protein
MKHHKIVIIGLIGLLIAVGIAFVGPDKIMRKLQGGTTILTIDRSVGEADFPSIDGSSLGQTQMKILSLVKQEFAAKPAYEKYSEGAQESWCADYVSWIMKQAGVPFKNPNSGSWRIPGTYTLHDYYVGIGKFKDASSGYEPKLGDVAIYRNSPVFGDHTNIVLKNEGGVLTTIGGNEDGRQRIFVNQQKNYAGLLGYGVLE